MPVASTRSIATGAVRMDDPKPGSEVAKLREQAKAMLAELPGAAKSGDLDGFINHLLPLLMTPHGVEQVSSAEPAARPPVQGTVKGLGGHTDWAGAASDIVSSAFQKCIESSTDDPVNREPTDWDPSVTSTEELPLRLARCKKCSRVVTQQRFADHWERCKDFDHTPFVERERAADLKKTITPAKKKDKPQAGWEDGYVDVEVEVTTCDGCGLSPVVGKRFQCQTCDEFDLCEACFSAGVAASKHDPTHQYTEVDIPAVVPRVALSTDAKNAQQKKIPIIPEGQVDFDR